MLTKSRNKRKHTSQHGLAGGGEVGQLHSQYSGASDKIQNAAGAVNNVKGCLTSSAKEVFLAHIHVQDINTKSAVLGLHFLLLAVAEIVKCSLALVRGVPSHGDVLGHFRGDGASVDAVGWSRQRGVGRRHGAALACHKVARAWGELRGALRCLRVEGHDGPTMARMQKVEVRVVEKNLGATVTAE